MTCTPIKLYHSKRKQGILLEIKLKTAIEKIDCKNIGKKFSKIKKIRMNVGYSSDQIFYVEYQEKSNKKKMLKDKMGSGGRDHNWERRNRIDRVTETTSSKT